MGLQFSLAFNGNCMDAIAFYSEVFGFEMPQVMTYGSIPEDPNFPTTDEAKNMVMYASTDILGATVMFCDWPPGMEYIAGNNVGPAIVIKDGDELTRLYHALIEGAKIDVALQKTDWSDLYAMFTDKFGVNWQLNLDC